MTEQEKTIDPITDQEASEMWANIISRIRIHEAQKRKKKRVQFASAIAAIILLFLGSIIIYKMYFLPNVYLAEKNDLTVILKDGSRITLFKGAKLTVEKTFPSATRDVLLEGDAIFKVSKSKTHPFIVHTASYNTKVLGTIFKITQLKSFFSVDLYEGKVLVNQNEKPKESFVIYPKEKFSNLGSNKVATIISRKIKLTDKKSSTATLSFSDIKLLHALTILERTYNIRIKYPAEIANAKISVIKENATAEELIRLIALQLNHKSIKVNDKVFELEE